MEIPPFFLCPISLEIMADPVSLATGITYDRSSIERWMFNTNGKINICPVTKQPLPPGSGLTPNLTLHRLIQSWCAANAVELRPHLIADIAHVNNLLATGDTNLILTSLSSLVADSVVNNEVIKSVPNALDFLASMVQDFKRAQEALSILLSLEISGQCLLDFVSRNSSFIDSLTLVLQQPNGATDQAQATLMLHSIIEVISPDRLTSLSNEFYRGLVQVIHNRLATMKSTKVGLKILCLLCPWGRNRVKAVQAGAVPVLIDLLIEEEDRRVCEVAMLLLDRLCGCADGRAELVRHAAGIAVVSKKILRVSEMASERAVRILHSVARYSATLKVVKEMLEVGVVSKLCLLVRGDCCSFKTREKAREILELHARSWKNSPCVYPHLRESYPSS